MGVPASEVGYTIATTRRETTKFHKNMWWLWGTCINYTGSNFLFQNFCTYPEILTFFRGNQTPVLLNIKYDFPVTNLVQVTFLILKFLKTRIKLYNTLALPVLLDGSETCTIKGRDARRITAEEMKCMRRTAGYTSTD